MTGNQATASATLVELHAHATTGNLDDEQLARYALAVGDVHGAAQAIPWYEAVLNRRPDHVEARYAYGCALLTVGEQRGVEHLRYVSTLAPTWGAAIERKIEE